MKIKIDENIPIAVVATLRELGHAVDSVKEEGLTGRADDIVWKAAQSESRFLITQDLDFSDVRRFTPGEHKGILLVRLHAPGRLAVSERTASLYQTEDVESWSGCFVIASEHKIRVKRPQKNTDQ